MRPLLSIFVFYLGFLAFSQTVCPNVQITDVEGSNTAQISCDYPFNENGCISLQADYTDIKSSSSYEVENIVYAPTVAFDTGTLVEIESDDSFSQVIDLPFSFCFYGQTYDSVVIGDNGLVSFDASLAGEDSPFYSSTLPNPALFNATIYGLYHDITNDDDVFGCTDNPATGLNECGEIRYQTVGVAPCRMFVINFNQLNHFNDEQSKSTFQVVLYEASSTIEINIKNKPINQETTVMGEYRKYATIGIQNHNGTNALSPEERNNEIFEAQNESWRFSPNGDSIVQLHWYENGEMIGMGDSIEICHREPTQIELEAIYELCNGNSYSITDQFNINYSNTYPRVEAQSVQFCDEEYDGEEVVNLLELANNMVNNSYLILIYNTLADAENGVNALMDTENVTVSGTQSFFVKLLAQEDCYEINELQIEVLPKPYANEAVFQICDIGNDGTELVNLNEYTSYITANSPNTEVMYFASMNDALNHQNAIEQFNLQGVHEIFVKLDISNACSNIESITFELGFAPHINDMEMEICDNVARVNLWEQIDQSVIDNNSSIQFFTLLENAENQTAAIGSPNNYRLNGITEIYVRVNQGLDCYAIGVLSINYLEAPTPINDIRVQCDSDIDELETFDLALSIPDMIEDTTGITIRYFETQNGAKEADASVEILDFNSYTVDLGKHQVYVRFESDNGCFAIGRITLHALPIPEPKIYEVEICDTNLDEEESILLSSIDGKLIGNQIYVENTYYLTEEDALNQQNEVFEVLVAPELYVYVRMAIVFEEEELCSQVYEILLLLRDPESNAVNLDVNVCDNMNDGQETIDLSQLPEIQNSGLIIENIGYFREDNTQIQNPYNYMVTEDHVIYIRPQTANTIDCDSFINLHITFSPAVTATDIIEYFCDPYPFNTETLNLFDILWADQPSLASYEVTFYTSQMAAFQQTPGAVINNPESFELNVPILIVYARIEGGEVCDSVVKLALKLKKSPYAYEPIVPICDTDNDGAELIQPNDYEDFIFGNAYYDVAFYSSEEDALNGVNPVQNITIHEPTTLYYVATNTAVIVCTSMGEVSFQMVEVPEPGALQITLCDNNNDQTEMYDLSMHEDEIISNPENFNFSYYLSQEDAENGQNAISNPNNFELTSEHLAIYVNVDNDNQCSTITNIQFEFALAPQVTDVYVGSCDDDFNMSETFNLASHLSELTDSPENYIVQYYRNYNAAISEDENYVISNPEAFTIYNMLETAYVKVTNPDTGCYSIGHIFMEIFKLPKLVDASIMVCDNDFDGLYEISLPEIDTQIIEEVGAYTFAYFTSYENAIEGTNPLNPNEIYNIPENAEGVYVVVTNEHGCSAISYALFTPGEVTEQVLLDSAGIENCDDDFDGIAHFDLTKIQNEISLSHYEIAFFTTIEEAQANENPIVDPQNYYNTTPTEIIYVRITESGKCSVVEHFAIKVNQLPANPFPEKYEKCPNEVIFLDAGEATSYLWSTGNTSRYLDVTDEGEYSVTITNENGCEYTYTVPVYNYALHSVNYVFTDQHTVVFYTVGDSTYEFSLDEENWQNSNVFFGLTQGTYVIYVRDKETQCVISLPFLVFDWYNIITPNGDGKNDSWKECGLEVFGSEMSTLKIFDRYGKVIHTEQSNSCFEWDGKYIGRSLPTDTYWFLVELPDGRKFNGYIAIKNYFNGSVR